MIITPKLRADVACFGSNECYPFAFGLPAILMTMALLIFVWGKSSYVIRIPVRNVLLDTCRASWLAVSSGVSRWKNGGALPRRVVLFS